MTLKIHRHLVAYAALSFCLAALLACTPNAQDQANKSTATKTAPIDLATSPSTPAPSETPKSNSTDALVKHAADGVLEFDWLALMSAADRARLESGEWFDQIGHDSPEASFTNDMASRQLKASQQSQILTASGYASPDTSYHLRKMLRARPRKFCLCPILALAFTFQRRR